MYLWHADLLMHGCLLNGVVLVRLKDLHRLTQFKGVNLTQGGHFPAWCKGVSSKVGWLNETCSSGLESLQKAEYVSFPLAGFSMKYFSLTLILPIHFDFWPLPLRSRHYASCPVGFCLTVVHDRNTCLGNC